MSRYGRVAWKVKFELRYTTNCSFLVSASDACSISPMLNDCLKLMLVALQPGIEGDSNTVLRGEGGEDFRHLSP